MTLHLRLLIATWHILGVVMLAFVIFWYLDAFPFLMAVRTIINVHLVNSRLVTALASRVLPHSGPSVVLRISHNHVVLITSVARTLHLINGRLNGDGRCTWTGGIGF